MDTAMGRIEKLKESFRKFSSWEEKYGYMISLGQQLPLFPEKHRLEGNRVRGCLSQVWLVCEKNQDGGLHFLADSDASIVKGIVAILLEVFDDLSPKEILDVDGEFLRDLGLHSHLSASRANGLMALMKQIKFYALAFGHLGDS